MGCDGLAVGVIACLAVGVIACLAVVMAVVVIACLAVVMAVVVMACLAAADNCFRDAIASVVVGIGCGFVGDNIAGVYVMPFQIKPSYVVVVECGGAVGGGCAVGCCGCAVVHCITRH